MARRWAEACPCRSRDSRQNARHRANAEPIARHNEAMRATHRPVSHTRAEIRQQQTSPPLLESGGKTNQIGVQSAEHVRRSASAEGDSFCRCSSARMKRSISFRLQRVLSSGVGTVGTLIGCRLHQAVAAGLVLLVRQQCWLTIWANRHLAPIQVLSKARSADFGRLTISRGGICESSVALMRTRMLLSSGC